MDGIRNLSGIPLTKLDLSYNKIADINELKKLNEINVEAVNIDGNPFVASFGDINDFILANLQPIRLYTNHP